MHLRLSLSKSNLCFLSLEYIYRNIRIVGHVLLLPLTFYQCSIIDTNITDAK
jgi:hypothetical protein